ncbi:UDP-N-acetylglucosamine 2-epimerase (hydrolyzing), partial [Clostridioides difficile]
SKRKICVITGSRAEYGLLSWVMREIIRNNELELQIIATGMHMSPEFGLTYSEIESDGFEINEKIEMLLSASTATAVVKSMGLATISFADSFQKLKPDVLLVLGDRFEILSAVQVALLMNIPIAHISGGELTEGAIDDSIRHAITKMSHIHYAATEEYAKRIIQMGEQPHAVINVGDLGVSNIKELNLISQGQLSEFFGFDTEGCLLVTFHPTTIEFDTAAEHMKSLLSALDHFPEYKVIITKSNADAEGRIINELIDEYALKHPDRVSSHTSLGRLRYLSTMKYCAAVIGNSSSGIIEAPVFQ